MIDVAARERRDGAESGGDKGGQCRRALEDEQLAASGKMRFAESIDARKRMTAQATSGNKT